MTDVPVAIFHYDGKQVVVLSANQAFRQIIRQALPAYNGKDLPLRIENLSFRQRLQPCLEELIVSSQEQVVTYIEEDHYLQLHLGLIAGPRAVICAAPGFITLLMPEKIRKPIALIIYCATSSNSIRACII